MACKRGACEWGDPSCYEICHLAGSLELPFNEEEGGASNGSTKSRPVAGPDGDVGNPRLILKGEEDGAVCRRWLLPTEYEPSDAGRSSRSLTQRRNRDGAGACERISPECDRLHSGINAYQSVCINERFKAIDGSEGGRCITRW